MAPRWKPLCGHMGAECIEVSRRFLSITRIDTSRKMSTMHFLRVDMIFGDDGTQLGEKIHQIKLIDDRKQTSAKCRLVILFVLILFGNADYSTNCKRSFTNVFALNLMNLDEEC